MNHDRTRESKFIVGLDTDDQEYSINGIRYVVSSRFQKPFEKPKNPMISERINDYLSGSFTELTVASDSDTMAEEYVCSAVGEEDLCSRKTNNKI